MKIKRRLWVLLLSAAMIITCLPAAVFAEDQAPDSGNQVAGETQVYEPKLVEYEGPPLRGVLGTDKLLNLETEDVSRFIVTFTGDIKKTFTYVKKEYKDESGKFTSGAFIDVDSENDPLTATTWLDAEVKQNDKTPVSFKREINDNVELQVVVHYMQDGKLKAKTLSAYADVLCAPDAYPTAVEFIPAEGFVVGCTAGFNYLTEEAFYGEGNKFKVSYVGWTVGDPEKGIEEGLEKYTTTYYYAKGVDPDGEEVQGFFVSGNVNRKRFILDEGSYCDLKFGKEAEVKFTYTEYVEDYDEDVSVDFKVPVKANKYTFTADNPIFAYTGKTITVTSKKIKVYDANGKRIPSEAYDVKADKKSKMGWYTATITLNSKFAARDKYIDSINTSYGIGPNAPTILKPVAGKKKLTVKWKKPSATQLKRIDGYYIELSTDKYFMGNYKRVRVSKSDVRKGKKLVKNLRKGKKYYVRLYAYKTVTQDGEKFKMGSGYSKVKTIKVK